MRRLFATVAAAIFVLCATSQAFATLAIDSQESANAAHHSITSPLTWSFTNTAGNLLIVGVIATGDTGTSTITGVTYNGVSMTAVTNAPRTWNTTASAVYLFFLVNPATGANTVSVSASIAGANPDIIAGAISFSGANTSSPVSAGFTNFSTVVGTTASVSVTGTTSGDFVVSAAGTGTGFTSANAPTVTSASANVSNFNAGDNYELGQQSTSGGSVTAGYTMTSDVFGIIAAEVFAATGAAGPPARSLLGVGQ